MRAVEEFSGHAFGRIRFGEKALSKSQAYLASISDAFIDSTKQSVAYTSSFFDRMNRGEHLYDVMQHLDSLWDEQKLASCPWDDV